MLLYLFGLEQHNLGRLKLLTKDDSLLTAVLGSNISLISAEYKGSSRLIVTTRKTLLNKGEDFNLKVRVLTSERIKNTTIFYKEMGTQQWKRKTLSNESRNVYNTFIGAAEINDPGLEYYIEVDMESTKLRYPSGDRSQTVVLW